MIDKHRILGIIIVIITICVSILLFFDSITDITDQYDGVKYKESIKLDTNQTQNYTIPKLEKGTNYEIILEFKTSNTQNKQFNASIRILKDDKSYFQKDMETTYDVYRTSYIPSKKSTYLKIGDIKPPKNGNYNLSIKINDLDGELIETNSNLILTKNTPSSIIFYIVFTMIITSIITLIFISIGLKLIWHKWNKELIEDKKHNG